MTEHPLFKSSDSGLLLVFMEPGAAVTLPEFHTWYDEEHVPLRIQRFTTFRSATRYAVTSTALTPTGVNNAPDSTWGAFYTISDNSVFADSSYTSLRSERSEREAELFTRLAIVDRRIYRLEYDSDSDETITVDRTKLGLAIQTEQATPTYIVTNSIDMIDSASQEEYNKWFAEEHIPMLAKVKGWRRSRRFTLIDAGVNGTGKSGEEVVPKCLGLHEWDEAPEEEEQYRVACGTKWRKDVLGGEGEPKLVRRERKTCQLYRAWDPLAAIEAERKK
ncbi:hypothetical protein PHSY_004423 [Pseudozyma hubeiensis SY62]|uniref:EthD domain-containing protein n=1 Tax=Pseudozyma hubeiensis (strain SY62) TaxID=1305764 RepID=R9P694_PSEHS|nr:hypothetical protein PHSY_004423 [Pseudozyma hubeiensis SY62]GAC96839.1 hypothetical protein PHSY_004423 [Pseudozyma hubeiensis SY62]